VPRIKEIWHGKCEYMAEIKLAEKDTDIKKGSAEP